MNQVIEETAVVGSPSQTITRSRVVKPEVRTEHPQRVYEKKKAILRSYQVIWYIVGFIEVLLGFRVTLLALGANPASGFASFMYGITAPFVAPFQGLVRSSVSPSGQVFEWSTIIAGAVYAFVAVGLIHLLQLAKPVSPQEVHETVDTV